MKKRLTLLMVLVFVPLVLLITMLSAQRAFRLSLAQETQRAQVSEGLIAQELRRVLAGKEYQDTLSLTRQYQERYASQGIRLAFVYNGAPLHEFALPQKSYQGLLNGQRAALLDTLSAPPVYAIGDPLTAQTTLLYLQDVSDVYALRAKLHQEALGYALLGALAVGMLALLLSHGLTRPLNQLTRAAQGLARGEGGEAPLPTKRQDEVGKLARTFQGMQDAVQTREQALQEQAAQRQHLLDALAHEMRTPLCSLLGNARLLEGEKLSAAQRSQVAGDMAAEIKRLADMDQQLLKLTTLPQEELEIEEIDIKALLHRSAARFAARFPHNPLLVEGPDVCLRGDEALLSLLADNLLHNALRASGLGQSVILQAIENGFSVIDEGHGMDAEQLRRATEPFYKGDVSRATGGTGLGLSLCRQIATLHGGALSLQSTPMQGTTVTVSLHPGGYFVTPPRLSSNQEVNKP